MNGITIRKAGQSDLKELMLLFEHAKKIMRESGNLHQWNGGYPYEETVSADIRQGNCYVLCDGNEITATMALIPGPEPTYAEIDGSWPDDEPYYVIHRLASRGKVRHVAKTLFDWACMNIKSSSHGRYSAIRIDTHEDNSIMKHVLEKYGFTRCGVIRLGDGSSREAYMRSVHLRVAEPQ